MHQDNFFLLAEPATCIAAWTPLDDTDEENGCLRVVPGSHREPIICPPTPKDNQVKTPRQTTIIDALVDSPHCSPPHASRADPLF